MRLGSYQAVLLPGSTVAEAYGTLAVTERHRHRFEFNNRYKARLEAVGLVCSGTLARRPPGRVRRAGRPPLLGGDPGAPRVQEPARPGPPALPRAGGGGARAGRGPRAAPARPRRRHLGPCRCPGFRRVSEEELLRARVFRVDRLHLVDPDGQPFDRFVMRHPGAVTVVPVHDDGRSRWCASTAPPSTPWCSRSRPGPATGTARRRGRRPGASWPRRRASKRRTGSC